MYSIDGSSTSKRRVNSAIRARRIIGDTRTTFEIISIIYIFITNISNGPVSIIHIERLQKLLQLTDSAS